MKFTILMVIAALGLVIPLLWITGTLTAAVYLFRQKMGATEKERTVAFDPALFTSIGVKLAQRAGVPVVPLALLTDAWGNGRLVLGVEPDHAYATARLRLEPGDILLLYTDGLTEAMDAAGECFGPDRLLAACRAPDGSDPFQLVRRIISAVAAHVGAAEQSDDLTLLAVARLEGVVQPVLERRVP